MMANTDKSSFDAHANWLGNILHLQFRTQDERRDLIIWLSGDIPHPLLKEMRVLAVTDEYPGGLEFEIQGDVEDFPGPNSIFYYLVLRPLDQENNEIKGRLHATNVAHLQMQLPTGERTIFVHCPKDGFFYPVDDFQASAEDLPAAKKGLEN